MKWIGYYINYKNQRKIGLSYTQDTKKYSLDNSRQFKTLKFQDESKYLKFFKGNFFVTQDSTLTPRTTTRKILCLCQQQFFFQKDLIN